MDNDLLSMSREELIAEVRRLRASIPPSPSEPALEGAAFNPESEPAPRIAELWRSTSSAAWDAALNRYWRFVKPANLELERALNRLDLERLRAFDPQGWYDFLRDEYFRWKYTAPNRYATTTRRLDEHLRRPNGLVELHSLKCQLLELTPRDTRAALLVAKEIGGLGVAGASGLLALMYPATLGTVDQFVVKALRDVGDLPEHAALSKMKPESLQVSDAVVLIGVMARKATELNRSFGTEKWTPRKLDQILWTYGR